MPELERFTPNYVKIRVANDLVLIFRYHRFDVRNSGSFSILICAQHACRNSKEINLL